MTTRKIPFLTLGLGSVLVVLYWLMHGNESLFFSTSDIRNGEYWRLITGHMMHADTHHLVWNCLGLLVLGTLIERSSRLDWWLALLVGMASVSVLLLSPFSHLHYYIGLSGVLNTLLLVALWKEWRDHRSWSIVVVFLACMAKVALEVCTGESMLTNISWPSYSLAHVAGLLGGFILVCSSELARSRVQSGFSLMAPGPDQEKGEAAL